MLSSNPVFLKLLHMGLLRQLVMPNRCWTVINKYSGCSRHFCRGFVPYTHPGTFLGTGREDDWAGGFLCERRGIPLLPWPAAEHGFVAVLGHPPSRPPTLVVQVQTFEKADCKCQVNWFHLSIGCAVQPGKVLLVYSAFAILLILGWPPVGVNKPSGLLRDRWVISTGHAHKFRSLDHDRSVLGRPTPCSDLFPVPSFICCISAACP